MPTAKMYECDTKRRFRGSDGSEEWRWIKKPVKDVEKTDEIRCTYCEAPVRLNRRKAATAGTDYIIHASAEDAGKCPGGSEPAPKKASKSKASKASAETLD